MIKGEEASVDKLIDFVENGTPIDAESIREALKKIYKDKNNRFDEKSKLLVYKVIGLINDRTQEVTDFIDVLYDKRLSDDEKNEFYREHYPFKGANLKIEKTIFETIYEVDAYKTYEDMIIDLIYDDVQEPEELKDTIKTILENNNISISFEDNNEETSHVKTR